MGRFERFLIAVVLSALPARPLAAEECIFIVGTGISALTVFEVDTQQVTARIPVGTEPEGIAVDAGAGTAFVTNAADNSISVIDLEAGIVVDEIAVGLAPSDAAVHPGGERLYVAERNSERVAVVDIAAREVIDTIPVGSGPTSIALRADGQVGYVANFRSNTVSVLDLAAGRVDGTIAVGEQPFNMALSPDESRLYVGNTVSETLSVIDTATRSVVTAVPIHGFPSDVAVHPSGSPVYVTRAFPVGDVAVIDVPANTLRTGIPVEAGLELSGVEMSADGSTAYVIEFGFGNLYFIDTVLERVLGFESIGGAGSAPQELEAATLPFACPRPPLPRLSQDLDATADEIYVDRLDALPISGTLMIGAELMTYRSVFVNRLREVTRGVHGTTAAAHAAGTAVYLVGVPPDANCDGSFGAADLSEIVRQLPDGDPGPCGGDVDRDQRISAADLPAAIGSLYLR